MAKKTKTKPICVVSSTSCGYGRDKDGDRFANGNCVLKSAWLH